MELLVLSLPPDTLFLSARMYTVETRVRSCTWPIEPVLETPTAVAAAEAAAPFVNVGVLQHSVHVLLFL